MYIYIHTYIHYITLHYITLHYITLHTYMCVCVCVYKLIYIYMCACVCNGIHIIPYIVKYFQGYIRPEGSEENNERIH